MRSVTVSGCEACTRSTVQYVSRFVGAARSVHVSCIVSLFSLEERASLHRHVVTALARAGMGVLGGAHRFLASGYVYGSYV